MKSVIKINGTLTNLVPTIVQVWYPTLGLLKENQTLAEAKNFKNFHTCSVLDPLVFF